MFFTLDSLLLKYATKISHWFQKITGKTNFFVARLGICITFVGATMIFFDQFFHIFWENATLYSGLLYLSFYSIWAVRNIFLSRKAEEHWLSGAKSKLRFYGDSPMLRIVGMFIFCFANMLVLIVNARMLSTIPGECLMMGILTFIYFMSVDPLPPCKSKIRKWIENIASIFSPAPEPTEG